MSPKQTDALLHAALTFLAGALAVFLTWFIGVASGHTVSIPILLTALPALLVGLASYTLHLLQPDSATPATNPPAPIVPIVPPVPPVPPTPPAGG